MTIQEAWLDGLEAALAGKPRENLNPWNTSLHCAWLRGWDAGAREELEDGTVIDRFPKI